MGHEPYSRRLVKKNSHADEGVDKEIKSIIREILNVQQKEILYEDTFVGLGMDSIDRIELRIALENKFGICIPEKDFELITTIQDLINYIGEVSA